ncbi:hypothetical protein ACHAXR_010564 [Thalassiosira sp. AJA248-18]
MSDSHLTFSIPSDVAGESPPVEILLNVPTTDDGNQGENETNTGFVMWPSAVMLAHYLSKNPGILRGDDTPDGDVMEMGAGCGLTGLTAATLLQNDDPTNDDKVVLTDYNPAVIENLRRNILLNEYDVAHEAIGLDWFDNDGTSDDSGESVEREDNTWVDTEGISHAQFRLILGADLIVCSNDPELVAGTIDTALLEGGTALIMGPSADARFGIAGFPGACRSLGMTVKVDENILETNENAREEDGSQQQLMDGLDMSRYSIRAGKDGHDFTMFTINKPITA